MTDTPRLATVKLDLSTTTATVYPDDGGSPEPYGSGLTRTTAPARLAEFGWKVFPKNKDGWALLPPDGYQCRAVQT
jgi:hypothetical protein